MNYEETLAYAIELAEDNFPEDKWHIDATIFADGDFNICIEHSFGRTDADNTVREEIEFKPHRTEYHIIEVTGTREAKYLRREQFDEEEHL